MSLNEVCATTASVSASVESEGLSSRRELFMKGALAATVLSTAAASRAQLQDTASTEMKLVNRLTYGLTATEANLARKLGYSGYLEYHLNFEAIDDSQMTNILLPYPSISQDAYNLNLFYSATAVNDLIDATIMRSIFSNRQLYEKMVEFWTDHFNIDVNKVSYFKSVDDRTVIRQYAMSTFPQLLSASAHSPAMLVYLDNNASTAANPNQNYARELMELHTLGVNGGYTQQDVIEVARCFSGWTYYNNSTLTNYGTFRFDPTRHDNGTKTVLGTTIPSGGGQQDGETVINILANHPSTAQFISTKMAKFLLQYSPPQSLIDKVAATYTATGGDIRSMIRVILNHGSVDIAPLKFKRPYHLMCSILRGLNATISSPSTLRNVQLAAMGHKPFNWSPPDGYPDTLEFWSGLLLPRWNFAFSLLNGNISGCLVDTNILLGGLTTAQPIANKINQILYSGFMPYVEVSDLVNYMLPNNPSTTKIKDAFALACAAPTFQWY